MVYPCIVPPYFSVHAPDFIPMHINATSACALLAGLAMAAPAVAQQSFGGLPASRWAELATPAALEMTGVPDVAAYMAEDEARAHRPLRYGALLDVDYSIENAGIWETTADGTDVWRLRIIAPGSKSIALEFSQFNLPEGAEMYVWEDGVETVLGAYTSFNNREDNGFVFEPFPGESLVLEVVQPSFVEFPAEVAVSTVIYDYRGVFELEKGLNLQEISGGDGSEGSCTIDVNCPQGDDWEVQKRSTVRTISGGSLCSGALINNGSGDLTQYVLTANHCGQGSNTIFRFNYQSSSCGGGSAPTNQNVSGATLLTTSSVVDSRFMRINSPIPSSYNPYWAGWSRSGSGADFTYAFALGHPGGGPKTITIDGNGASAATSFWNLVWSEGMLQGGNSGGPLFDQNGRIRGNACCVNSLTQCNGQSASFGRFDRFWQQNGLAQWLDPNGMNLQFMDGTDVNGGGGPSAPTISSASPASQPVVNPEGPLDVVITGTGFLGAIDLRVDGVSLPSLPPSWSVNSDTQITIFDLPQQDSLGPKTIELVTHGGTATVSHTIVANFAEPVLDLLLSDPAFLISALGIQAYVGSLPNDVAILAVSTSNLPSVLPGLVSLDIGNNFTEVFNFGTQTIDPTSGYAFWSVPLQPALPIGLKLYVQAVVIDGAFPVLPVTTTNVQSGTKLF